MTAMTDLIARRAAMFARTTTPALVGAALILDAKRGDLDPDERLALAWTNDEIERRAGGIVDDEAFDALLDTHTYVEALLVTFPGLSA